MSSTVLNNQLKRYASIDKTLTLLGRTPDIITLVIKLEQGVLVNRSFSRWETKDPLGDRKDSQEWTDSIIKRGPIHMRTTPWAVWKKAGKDVDRIQVIAAVDGSGKWMLDLLPKADVKVVKKERKDAKIADRAAYRLVDRVMEQARRNRNALVRDATRRAAAEAKLLKKATEERRAEEAKAFKASVKNLPTGRKISGVTSPVTVLDARSSPPSTKFLPWVGAARRSSLEDEKSKGLSQKASSVASRRSSLSSS